MTDDAETAQPPPTFDVLPLSPDVRRAVDELGYVHPTPVQRAVYEPAARGTDLVVQARTGTGKTAAFGMPILDASVKKGTARVQAIILSPTRELALQINRELDALGKYRGVKVTAVYGGAPMGRQIQAIEDGAQVVVGTPGRVLDHLRRGTLDPSGVRIFVLDESDEMLSMGFLPQITEVMEQLPESRQTLLFSATLPADIQRVAETRLKDPEFITLSGDQVGALEIDHYVYMSPSDKTGDLLKVIEVENPESAIIFCNTRDDTRRVAAALSQEGFDADWLNAELPQSERETVMARTREGKLRFLVATDVAARGIDISHLTHVINYGFPESAEQYVHRTGRTGRAGRTGTAISLIEPSDIGNLYYLRLTYKIRPLEKSLPSAQELRTRGETDLVESFVELYGKGAHADDLALARRLLTHPLSEQVIAGLIREHLGARPNAEEEASAARRSRAPAPAPAVEAPRQGRQKRTRRRDRAEQPAAETTTDARVDTEPREGGRAPRKSKKTSDDEGARDAAPRFEVAEVFVNVGRKDGARASDFYDALSQRGGVSIDDTDYVNVRQKNAFIGVRKECLDKAVEALNGATIAGREATAEPSRSRP